MRILAVRGENLASLAREFEVELGAGPLAASGVFAIVGPTGSGKSTLLDAICVALFDRTPRLGGRSSVLIGRGDDIVKLGAHDVRTILRRGATRGWAEVEFEGVDGRRYRSRWEVWRAQRGASGRLQDQRITLTCVDTGERIGGTRTETLDAIRARLGLKFEQFCRSALLAQGEFAAFLRADAADRADLLERMTGTEIYGELSLRAHRRAAELEAGLRERRAGLASIAPLADEARAETAAGKARAEHDLIDARARRDAVAARARWAAQRGELVRAIAAGESERDAAARAWTATAELRDQLARARRAEAVRPAWDEQVRAAAAVAEADRATALATAAIGSIGKARDRAVHDRDAIDAVLARARAVRIDAGLAPADAVDGAPRSSRPLDRKLVEARVGQLATSLATVDERRRAAGEAITLARGQVQAAEHQAGKFEAARKRIPVEAARRAYDIAEHGIKAARALAEVVATARKAAADHTAAIAQRDAHAAELDRHRAAAAAATTAAAAARLRLDEAQAALDRLVAAAALDHHRSQLVDGEPCPLCGATAHPWSGRGAVDQLIEDERRRLAGVRGEVEAAVAAAAAAATAIDAGAAAIARLATAATDAAGRRDAATAEFRGALAALGELPWSDDPADPAAEQLAADRAAIAGKAFDKARVARSTAEAADQAATDARAEVMRAQADLDHAVDRERSVNADADKVAAALRAVEAELFAARAAAEVAVHGREREVAAAEAQVVAAGDAGARARVRLADASAARAAALVAADLTEAEVAALMARAPGWADTVRVELDAVIHRQARAAAVVDDRVAQLAAHDDARPPVPETVASPGAEPAEAADGPGPGAGDDGNRLAWFLTAATAAVTALENEIVIAGERLRADDDVRDRRHAAEAELATAEAASGVDRVLAELIGSHDGKAFRSFAQSLTLDALLVVANDHLHQLAPRYQLERVPNHDLELQIVDRDLGDEVRSVSSLSGGESFLVSLALALALSSVSARNVRVRTLLIDEGFGTLDPGALDTALSVLDALQATGCQVGIISHVPGLIERVGAHVVVRPLGGGRSAIEIRAAS